MPKTPYLHLLPPRLAKAAERLRQSIWTVDDRPLPISGGPSCREHVAYSDLPRDFVAISEFPHFWGKSFDQRWFRLELSPGDLRGFTHLDWRDRGEATVYFDGQPGGGIDPGHPYVELPPDFSEVLIESICCRTGIWVHNETQGIDDRGSCLTGAFLARRDTPIA